MVPIMLQPFAEQLKMILAWRKCLWVCSEIIPKLAYQDQLFFRGEIVQFREFLGNHASNVSENRDPLKLKGCLGAQVIAYPPE